MKMKAKSMTAGLLLILFCGMSPAAAGQAVENAAAARVRLSVFADEKIKGLISSYMARDLRALGDVLVTENDPDWYLWVTAIELKRGDGTRTGVAISAVIVAPMDKTIKQSILQILEKDGSLPAGPQKLKIQELAQIKSNILRADADTAVRELCRGIIADFDTEYLQPARGRKRLP